MDRPRIHVLDSGTIDKIAAGEVVERPSSVVKELVENAIDANAKAITVEIKEGGIEFIRVTDNGWGMEREQLETAFLRHATSKIQNSDDLMRISSLGFRGEALSSIAAVAKVEVISKTADHLTGSRICLEGGKQVGLEEIGAPEGTTFLVRNLFYNTPVRRKFLKQPATEGSYITDLMEHLALSRPDISIKLIVNNQVRFHTSGNGELREVIYRIYGREVAEALVPIQWYGEGISVEGYLGKPVQVRSNRNFEIYFINGRYIRSSVVARAIEEGYKEYLMQHKFPLCILHISMDPERVDVNVHPTKMDVRFTNAMGFSALLCGAVKFTLKSHEMIPETSMLSAREEATARKEALKTVSEIPSPELFESRRTEAFRVMEETQYKANEPQMQDFMQNPVWARIKEKEELPRSTEKGESISCVKNKKVEKEKQELEKEEEFFSEVSELSPVGTEEKAVDLPDKLTSKKETPVIHRQISLFEEKILTEDNRKNFRIIGQVFETYWLIEYENKLLMMDQHAAHEKVNYERIMKRYHNREVLSQNLMPSIVVSLSAQEEAVYLENREVFQRLGFEVESFGGKEYTLRSVPVDLYGCNEKEMFLEVLDQLLDGIGFGGIKVIEERIASMSCKASVKGNQKLSREEAERLLDELLTLDNPYNCPHGRPTIVTISKQEMEKKFKRIVT